MANNATLILLLGITAGLTSPFLSTFPTWVIGCLLAPVIYLSLFKISLSELSRKSMGASLVFVLLRFIVIPVMFWVGAHLVLPGYAREVLFMTLMPAGSSAPAFSGILGGSIGLSVAVTVLSSILAVFTIPCIFSLLEGEKIPVPVGSMSVSLLLIIGLPILFFLISKNSSHIRRNVENHSQIVSNILIAWMIGIALSHQRAVILQLSPALLYDLLVLFGLFSVYFITGWYLSPSKLLPQRISFMMASGINNNALGVGLSAAFLPNLVLFFVLSEIPWSCGLIFARAILRSHRISNRKNSV